MTPQNTGDCEGPPTFHDRDGRLIVCRLGAEAVQKTNRAIEDFCGAAETTKHAATPAPLITEILSVQDRKAQALHVLLIHRLDYRPRKATVGNVVVFSEPRYTAFRTKTLQLATPAFYRKEESLKAGIGDREDGTLIKDATQWANDVVSPGIVTHAEISFAAPREPWVYCASHYRTNRELRRLREHFAKYGYSTATGIADPNAFATWLGIDFALTLKKTTEVRLQTLDELGYAQSRYATDLWDGSGQIDTVVHVYHGPISYEDNSGGVATEEDWFDPSGGPKAWFTKKTCFESQSEYRFAVATVGDPVEPRHYIEVSPELRKLTSAL